MIQAHVLVNGRVQGVFFRSALHEQATRKGVTGWTRNLADGRVEAVLEGDKQAVNAVIQFCKKGPKGAVVTNVQANILPYTGKYDKFEILY